METDLIPMTIKQATDEFLLLFGEDANNDETPILDTMDAAKKIYGIKATEKQIAMLELHAAEATAFFKKRIAACQQRIEFLKTNLQGYLNHNQLKNLSTPYGIVYQRTINSKHWPEIDVLVEWAQLHLPTAIRSRFEPDKKALYDHITATGETPDGFSEQTETRIYIK